MNLSRSDCISGCFQQFKRATGPSEAFSGSLSLLQAYIAPSGAYCRQGFATRSLLPLEPYRWCAVSDFRRSVPGCRIHVRHGTVSVNESDCLVFPNQLISDAGIPCAEDVLDNPEVPTWQDSPRTDRPSPPRHPYCCSFHQAIHYIKMTVMKQLLIW